MSEYLGKNEELPQHCSIDAVLKGTQVYTFFITHYECQMKSNGNYRALRIVTGVIPPEKPSESIKLLKKSCFS